MRLLSRIRAWMVVPVVDFALMLAPLAWRPPQIHAIVMMAVLATLLLTDGGRYVAPLHLSVLDELPSIVTRLLAAVAAVSAAILYLYHKVEVLIFLQTACQAVVLVIVGRLVTTRLIAIGRRSGIAKHHTVLIGGGPLATELARILAQHREYGITLDGFVDDGRRLSRQAVPATPGSPCRSGHCGVDDRRGHLAGGRWKLRRTRADRCGAHRGVSTRTNLFVVPRIHHFHTQTGMADHIGSIPIMRVRNPNLHGPARLIKRGFDIVVAVMSLIILLPVLAAAALAVRIEGGPGVIFRQVRVGRDGKHFELLKFRSMRPANELESQTEWCVATDEPRRSSRTVPALHLDR